MANFYFFSALMKYGTFDEYHFFLSNAAHCTMFLKYHAPIFEVLGVQERVRVFDRLRIQEAVTKHDYTVFHQSDHITLFNKLCRFRNSIGAGFPVTGFIHSISYQQYMASYLEMLEIGATPGDALICSSGSGKQVLESCFDRLAANLAVATNRLQMPVVPLGIDEDGEVPLKETARDHLKLSRDEVIALVFGRFSDVDKMDIFPLIQAFQQAVGHDEVRWRLVLAGSVHSRVYLKMLEVWIDALGVKDRVTILTEPTETEKQHLYGAADFFVSLSDNPQETFGLTVLEAMWAGLPLLVSDFDGYRELVSDAVGIRVPTYWAAPDRLRAIEPLLDDRTFHLYASQAVCVDIQYLTAALSKLYRDESMRKRMSAAAKARFEKRYAHRLIIGELETLWDDLKADFRASVPRDDWMSLDTFNTFFHYVTRRLSHDEQVKTTVFGLQILKKQGMHPLLPNMAEIVDNEAVISMMTAAANPIAVSDFLEQAGLKSPEPGYLLLWMMKHGLLGLCKDTNRSSVAKG